MKMRYAGTMLQLLNKGPVRTFVPDTEPKDDDREESGGIRCPLCGWQPAPSSVWACQSSSTPEPFFPGCGTVWNTFTTGGVCPGCSHKWKWTSCPGCGGWSLHEDWYDDE
jgi:hypothetical protein